VLSFGKGQAFFCRTNSLTPKSDKPGLCCGRSVPGSKRGTVQTIKGDVARYLPNSCEWLQAGVAREERRRPGRVATGVRLAVRVLTKTDELSCEIAVGSDRHRIGFSPLGGVLDYENQGKRGIGALA
jgi:hypothetical protein